MKAKKPGGGHEQKYRKYSMLARGGVIALGLWGAVLSDGERATANAGPFPGCSGDMYIMRETSASGGVNLYTVDVNNQFELVPGTEIYDKTNYNSAGFNIVDNYIYAIGTRDDGDVTSLLRIHADGTVDKLKAPDDFHPSITIPGGSNSAEIGPDGMMYIFALSHMYRLDLSNLNDPNALMRVQVNGGQDGFADIAYHDGKVYGVNSSGQLAAIDVSSAQWAVNGTSVVNKIIVGGGSTIDSLLSQDDKPKNYAFGAMFGGSNGIYGNANTGGFYYFDLTTGLAQKLANSQLTSRNDGAKCYDSPLRLPSRIRLSKTSYPDDTNRQPSFAPGKKTRYRVVVKNDSTIGMTGIKLSDPLPAGITNATWACEQAMADPAFTGCRPHSGTGPLEAMLDIGSQEGSFVSYIVEIDVPADVRADLVNIATLEMPLLSLQANGPELTAKVTKKPALLVVEKEGQWVDTNKSNTANVGDHMDYVFTVTNSGEVPLTDVKVIDLMVTVVPDAVASLAPGEVATFTATYALSQSDIDNGKIVNTATGTGILPDGETVESPQAVSETEFPPAPEVGTKKAGRFLDDVITNEFPDEGEHVEYTVTVKNTGNVTMVAYPPIDAGPTIDGKPMTGQMSSFVPDEQIVPPGEERSFTALYALSNEDISDAAGVMGGMQNTVETPVQTLKEYEEGKTPRRHRLEDPSLITLPGYAIDKKAQVSQISRGQQVPWPDPIGWSGFNLSS